MRIFLAVLSFLAGAAIVLAATANAASAAPPSAADRTILAHCTGCDLAGAHWAHASACGPATVEDMKDDDNVGYGCGMGHIPAKSSRFLYFFAKSPRQMDVEAMAQEEKKRRK